MTVEWEVCTLEAKEGRHTPPGPPSAHGRRRGCRCDECARLGKEYDRAYRDRVRGGPPRSIPEHGTRGRYAHHKCRCEPCTAANREYGRGYMWLYRQGITMNG